MNWKEIIKEEAGKPYYQELIKFVLEDSKKYIICPSRENIFKAFELCPLEQTKVVILGQDPYHGPNQAHGLSFSVPNTELIPPSLRNIFKEIKSDLGINKEFIHGNLEGWAKQGVLLLNSVLTVRQTQAASHQKKGWETFTDKIIRAIDNFDRPIVFILWGNFARNKKQLIQNSRHLVLEGGHPSPLSSYLFFGGKYFSKTNEFLIKHQINPIDWVIR